MGATKKFERLDTADKLILNNVAAIKRTSGVRQQVRWRNEALVVALERQHRPIVVRYSTRSS